MQLRIDTRDAFIVAFNQQWLRHEGKRLIKVLRARQAFRDETKGFYVVSKSGKLIAV